VSIVLPALNERAYIRDCLESLLVQDYPAITEILVLDGGSRDGTQEIVRIVAGCAAVVDNPGVTAASGLNLGFALARGEVIVRADAHARYARDYVRRCVAVLLETGADNVGGRMTPVGTTSFGRGVAAVTSSPLGVGPGRFHYATDRQEVDTVYLGCWWREKVLELGGFDDTRLQWAAEDHELNFRLRASGGRIVLDPDIRSWYFPRDTPTALWRQYFNYGVGKASTLAKHHDLPTWRPLAPAALVLATVVGALGFPGWRRLVAPAGHGAVCLVAALQLSRDPGVAPHRAWTAIEICHWSYGLGFWTGLSRWLAGGGFASRGNRP
jgi:succinoglycan biosynthesis protein ExoA